MSSDSVPNRGGLSPRATIVLLCLTHLVIGLALGLAVGWRTAGERPRLPSPGEMEQRLELDAEQSKKIKAIFERHKPEFDRLRDDHRALLRPARDRVDAEMKEVLTPAQFEKLLQVRQEFEALEGAGPPGGPPGERR